MSQIEYDFTLILAGINDFDEQIVDKLFEAGCDDATVAQRYGRVYVTFSREADSLSDAMVSAVRDVERADIGATVLRVDTCNLVTQSEIARRLSRTRQAIDFYVRGKRGPGGFPPPACNITDGVPLYYWCEVAHWAKTHDLLSASVNREAQEVATLNTILELEHQKRISPMIAAGLLARLRPCEAQQEGAS